jgi:3',5'-cyclic AMP phosphodiesterase CpdA
MKSPIQYLFRYRDLIDKDTLARHRELIDEFGACWWGWWQRPGEDQRTDRWLALGKLAAATTRIGLFDSDPDKPNGQIHLATLSAVIMPTSLGAAPSVPEGESRLIPAYYRSTAFSSAWLKLTCIDKEPLVPSEFFQQYSYAKAPALKGISDVDREKYANKQIVDAAELRSMDATIWEVRPRQEGDGTERILSASARVNDPLSSEPIALKSGLILHLSDLHFATEKFRSQHRWKLIGEDSATLHSRVVQALKKNDAHEKIGLVVISGDLTYVASDTEFYEAFRFIHALLGALRLGPEHLVIVPGNHDIAWTKKHDEVWDATLPVDEAHGEATRAFRKFYERVFRHRPSDKLSMARRFILPSGLVLEVGALNTSALESGKNWLAGMGRIADGAFDEIQSSLSWQGRGPSLRLLVLHHHLNAVEDVLPTGEYRTGFGMASDARQTIRKAAEAGVQLALHGHRHLPFVSIEQVYAALDAEQADWKLGRVAVIGSGSAGSTEVNADKNYFNLLEVAPEAVRLTMFRARSPEHTRGDFTPLKGWTSKLSWECGQLHLSDWERD